MRMSTEWRQLSTVVAVNFLLFVIVSFVLVECVTISFYTYTHTHTRTVSIVAVNKIFEGYMVEARESTQSGSFGVNSSIWGEWVYNETDPYHSVNCLRSMNSTDDTYFPVSYCEGVPGCNVP